MMRFLSCFLCCLLLSIQKVFCFVAPLSPRPLAPISKQRKQQSPNHHHNSALYLSNKSEEDRILEESRVKILTSRRQSIRGTLKFAEQIRNFRLSQGWVPQVDPETGKPISDSKLAVSLTAFCIAGGAVALRVGGRAALVSAVGLDFVDAELKEQLDAVLNYANDMDLGVELLLFVAAWTAVKVFLFDAGGVVLALSSGILFGGVLQGAVASATAATIGSTVCFALAKMDTPIRQKALEVVDEYPSLRGIEKVVAQDGFKAILTLRLAPILPIPLGLYNYVYGVTNVPVVDFMAGIFFGSFKPYLLDSYLGYFGKAVMDGGDTAGDSMQDVILLVALGLSVLIGVFASQLASETWDTVLEEMEEERLEKQDPESLDTIVSTNVAGMQLPEWAIDWQLDWGQAEERMMNLVAVERRAQVYNYTSVDAIPMARNPALAPNSPEAQGVGQGFNLKDSVLDGLVLSPVLFSTLIKYADPLYDPSTEEEEENEKFVFREFAEKRRMKEESPKPIDEIVDFLSKDEPQKREALRSRVKVLRDRTERRLARLESLLESSTKSGNVAD